MTTATVVMDRALALAQAGTEDEEAISDLLVCCGDNRVAVVMARRHFLEPSEPQGENAERAVKLLDEVLRRLAEV